MAGDTLNTPGAISTLYDQEGCLRLKVRATEDSTWSVYDVKKGLQEALGHFKVRVDGMPGKEKKVDKRIELDVAVRREDRVKE